MRPRLYFAEEFKAVRQPVLGGHISNSAVWLRGNLPLSFPSCLTCSHMREFVQPQIPD